SMSETCLFTSRLSLSEMTLSPRASALASMACWSVCSWSLLAIGLVNPIVYCLAGALVPPPVVAPPVVVPPVVVPPVVVPPVVVPPGVVRPVVVPPVVVPAPALVVGPPLLLLLEHATATRPNTNSAAKAFLPRLGNVHPPHAWAALRPEAARGRIVCRASE